MGGEKYLPCFNADGFVGSPPRGRGKVRTILPFCFQCRITPAWAGKSSGCRYALTSGWDHPRVGGEKASLRIPSSSLSGSPPRGRGKVLHRRKQEQRDGITPAWAGKSSGCRYALTSGWDHPRVGGEKMKRLKSSHRILGSPPRGRGKESCSAHMCLRHRITPAWAGKRLKRSHRSGIFISGPIPFHSVLHRPAGSGGSRAGRDGSPAGQPQNTGPA